jgi:hypothetical protein
MGPRLLVTCEEGSGARQLGPRGNLDRYSVLSISCERQKWAVEAPLPHSECPPLQTTCTHGAVLPARLCRCRSLQPSYACMPLALYTQRRDTPPSYTP